MAYTAKYIYQIVDRFSKPLNNITRANQRFHRSMAMLTNRAERMQNALDASERSIAGFGRAATGATAPVNSFARATEKINVRSGVVATRISSLSSKIETAGQRMANFRSVIGGAALTVGMFKFASAASSMSDAMADVARVTGLTGPELARMQESLQRLGRRTGRNAEGLAAMAYEGGKLGIANDQLVAFVEGVMKTAVAFDMADSEAGRAIGSIRAKLGLSVASVDELMQRVNFLADNTSASGAQMVNIIERTSGTFKTLNIPPEVTAGWAAFANQVEVTPELAASGLNMMMRQMMKMPGMLDKMLKDPKNSVTDFLKRFKDMPEAKRGAVILKTFGDEAGRFVMKAVANTKLLDDAMAKAASSKALGSMDREFSNIMKRSSTAAGRIKQTLLDVARAVGKVFLKAFDKYSDSLQKAAQWVLLFVKAHPGLIKLIGAAGLLLTGLAAVVVPLGILLGMAGAALPILTGLSGAIAAISWPVVAVVAGVALLTAGFMAVWYQSTAFRQSLLNLYDAFSPLIDLAKQAAVWIGTKLAEAFGNSGMEIKSWGDAAAVVINMVAALIRTLIDTVIELGGFWKQYLSGDMMGMLDTMGGWGKGLLEKIGLGSATQKTAGRQDNKMEISGQIGVSASGGAKVERAEIGLNTGYNLAVAQ